VEKQPHNPQSKPAKLSDDVLLESLLHVCAMEDITMARSSLIAGLPLINGKLSPELLLRSAERAGLNARVVKRALSTFSNRLMPIILIFEDNNAVVLESLSDSGSATIYLPLEQARKHVTLSELEAQYSGMSILTRPVDRLEKRIEAQDTADQIHWFWGVIGRSWRIYRDVLIASFMINIFVVANPLFVMNVYDRVVPNNAIETLWALALGILVLYGFDLILRLLRTYFIEVAGKKSDVLLSAFIMERILGAHYSEHPQSVGAFASKVREFETIRNFITSATISTFVDLPFVILFLVVVAYVGGAIVWVPIIGIPLILLYAWFVHLKLKNLVANTFIASAQKNATLVEALTSLETLKGLGAESRVLRKWESSVGLLAFWGVKLRVLSVSATTVSQFIQQISAVFVVIVGVYSIANNTLTQGALIASVILVSRALAPLAQVSGLLVQYHQSVLALESLEDIVTREQERPNQRKFIERIAFNGDVTFDQVDFTYPGESQQSLVGVSFSIRAKEKVAIIGRIGSGKSTIQKLLMGLYRPQNGAVLVDGIDITQIDPAQLRHNVGYVPQDSVLFYGNIRDNIAYRHGSVSDSDVIRAADIAGVSEFVNQHPKGFERMVGERGEGLSGGQRQAINVARGLVSQPSMILLDEPSTSMDNTTEGRLIESLKGALEDATLLLVTHKTTMLSLVDRVIVVERGRIVADGPKDVVLDALKKGRLRVT